MDLGSGASTPASSFAVGNEEEPIAPSPTPNNTSRLMKAMADRSLGHRGATIKRKKSYKIVGVVQNRPVVAGEGLEFWRRAPKW